MQAIVQDSYGGPDVLELADVDVPALGDRDVLVRVAAAGVDPGVWHLMTGMPYLVRGTSKRLERCYSWSWRSARSACFMSQCTSAGFSWARWLAGPAGAAPNEC